MYEQIRNTIINNLYSILTTDQIDLVMQQLDKIFINYNISTKETNLIIYHQDMPQLVEMYLKVKSLEGLSELTLKNRAYLLRNFFFTIQKPVKEITSNDIRVFLYTYKEKNNVSNSTLDSYRSSLKAFFNWLVKEEFINKNPMDKIGNIRIEQKQRDAFTLIQLNQIRKACKNIRDRAIIELIFSSGARRAEVSNLNINDILWDQEDENGVIPIKLFGKGKKERTSFISPKAASLIKEYLKTRKNGNIDNEALFLSLRAPYNRLSNRAIENIFEAIAKTTQISPCTPHILRHTMATYLLENGAPIQIIQILLGHSSLDTTRIYAKNSYTTVKKTYSEIFNKEESLTFANQ